MAVYFSRVVKWCEFWAVEPRRGVGGILVRGARIRYAPFSSVTEGELSQRDPLNMAGEFLRPQEVGRSDMRMEVCDLSHLESDGERKPARSLRTDLSDILMRSC